MEIKLEQLQTEIFLNYYIQFQVPSYVDFLEMKTEKRLFDLALAEFLKQRLRRMMKGKFLTSEEFFQKIKDKNMSSHNLKTTEESI